jgi:hypothetical protein
MNFIPLLTTFVHIVPHIGCVSKPKNQWFMRKNGKRRRASEEKILEVYGCGVFRQVTQPVVVA